MSYTKKTLEELNVMDDFLMNALASDEKNGEEFCRKVLSTLLNREVGNVHVVAQKVIPALTPEMRGIRLDVEVMEKTDIEEDNLPTMHIYDIEPQNQERSDLLRRNRFYQAKMDARHASSGDKFFSNLPNLYILTITPYDPFGYDYMVYTVHNVCEEIPEMPYEDGLEFLYFNTKGTKGGSPEIQAMLRYFQTSIEANAVNDTLKSIHTYVKKVKRKPEVEIAYMKFEELMYFAPKSGWEDGHQQGLHQGIQQGIQQGLDKTNRLYALLLADKRYQDLERSTTDPEYQKILFLEYGL